MSDVHDLAERIERSWKAHADGDPLDAEAVETAIGLLDRGEIRVAEPDGDGGWVNGGYFVCEPGVIDYIDSDRTVWEQEPLERLAHEGKLAAYRHSGFWHPLDTLRDRMVLEEQWQAGEPAWRSW